MNQSNPERTGRAMTMREIREALGHNVNPQPPVDRAAWVDGDPLLEAIARAVWEQCSTEGTSLVVDDPRNIAAVAATAARAAVRAETLRDAEEICDEAGAVYTSKSLNGEATGAYELRERFRRKAEEAETATPAVVAAPTGRAARVAAALREHGMVHLGDQVPADEYDCCADAVLAVLPEQADRAAVLDEAVGAAETMAIRLQDDRKIDEANGAFTVMAHLRRLAVEAHGTGTQQQPDTEAHPPRHSWLVEWSADGDDWAVAYPTHDHSKALDRLARGRRETPDWQWRLVRETTTYTVEEPAPVAQQPAAEVSAVQPVRHAPGTAILCPDCRAKGYAVCMTAEQQPAADGDEETNRG